MLNQDISNGVNCLRQLRAHWMGCSQCVWSKKVSAVKQNNLINELVNLAA